VVLKKPIRDRVRNHKNLKVKDLVITGLRSRGQTRDLSSRRRLGGLYSKVSGLKIKLI